MNHFSKALWEGLSIRVGLLLLVVFILVVGMFAPKQTLDLLREHA